MFLRVWLSKNHTLCMLGKIFFRKKRFNGLWGVPRALQGSPGSPRGTQAPLKIFFSVMTLSSLTLMPFAVIQTGRNAESGWKTFQTALKKIVVIE